MDRKRSDTSSETNEKTVEIFQAGDDGWLRYRRSGRGRKQGADTRDIKSTGYHSAPTSCEFENL